MATGSSSASGSASGGAISTFKGEERALRADRLGTGGLLLSVLAATAPLMVVAGVMPTTFASWASSDSRCCSWCWAWCSSCSASATPR